MSPDKSINEDGKGATYNRGRHNNTVKRKLVLAKMRNGIFYL
jgi:hypothetical protein